MSLALIEVQPHEHLNAMRFRVEGLEARKQPEDMSASEMSRHGYCLPLWRTGGAADRLPGEHRSG